MTPVDPRVHFAAHRLGLVSAAGARKVGAFTREMPKPDEVVTSEFALPSGEVISRRVGPLGAAECWLRDDIAAAAEQALHAEAAEAARVAREVVDWSRGRDSERAAEQGVSLEQYRQVRNHTLARIDQRRGKSSIGM